MRIIFLTFEMVFTAIPIAHFANAYACRHILQLAIAIHFASEAIQWMIRQNQLNDILAQRLDRFRLRENMHAWCNRRMAGCHRSDRAVRLQSHFY